MPLRPLGMLVNHPELISVVLKSKHMANCLTRGYVNCGQTSYFRFRNHIHASLQITSFITYHPLSFILKYTTYHPRHAKYLSVVALVLWLPEVLLNL